MVGTSLQNLKSPKRFVICFDRLANLVDFQIDRPNEVDEQFK